MVRPPLPPLESRYERFDAIVAGAVDFLQSAWEELRDVNFEVAEMPMATDDRGIPRWLVDHDGNRVVLFRLPIERLSQLGVGDDLHHRITVESAVFRAAAEFLGRDPWDLGPERFGFL